MAQNLRRLAMVDRGANGNHRHDVPTGDGVSVCGDDSLGATERRLATGLGEATPVRPPQEHEPDGSTGDLLNQVGPPRPCPVGFTRAQRPLSALDDEALRLGDQVVPVAA